MVSYMAANRQVRVPARIFFALFCTSSGWTPRLLLHLPLWAILTPQPPLPCCTSYLWQLLQLRGVTLTLISTHVSYIENLYRESCRSQLLHVAVWPSKKTSSSSCWGRHVGFQAKIFSFAGRMIIGRSKRCARHHLLPAIVWLPVLHTLQKRCSLKGAF